MNAEAHNLAAHRTGMADSLMHEIAGRLADLAGTGQTSAIDLRSLPMTPADRRELEDRLGRGEIEARLTAGGASEIWETRYAGVWWVRHFGAGDKIAAEHIDITLAPRILTTHEADAAAAAARLKLALAEGAPLTSGEEHQHG